MMYDTVCFISSPQNFRDVRAYETNPFQGHIVTFNRRSRLEPNTMDVQQLLEVKPDELAKGLLARWKALEEQLPNVIRNLEAEEEAPSPMLDGKLEKRSLPDLTTCSTFAVCAGSLWAPEDGEPAGEGSRRSAATLRARAAQLLFDGTPRRTGPGPSRASPS